MKFTDRMVLARAEVAAQCNQLDAPFPRYALFFSVSDGARALIFQTSADEFDRAWALGAVRLREAMSRQKIDGRWLRIDWVYEAELLSWANFKERLSATKRGYFRHGLSLDTGFRYAFLEQELNANAMLYPAADQANACVNDRNFARYANARYGDVRNWVTPETERVVAFSAKGIFCDTAGVLHRLHGPGLDSGRRQINKLTASCVKEIVSGGADYLAAQVKESGQFVYGCFPCFDRPIDHYNAQRHASSTYAMMKAWELTRSDAQKRSFECSLAFLTQNLIKEVTLDDNRRAAYLVYADGEIKIDGNALCLLALVKYAEVTGSKAHYGLMEALATGITHMQDPVTGQFVHVMNYPELSIKEPSRINYYGGETAFGLMRLYGLTKDPRWLASTEKAFEYFISRQQWKARDRWLSCCVNELTRYKPEERYFRFGLQNVTGYLDFVLQRETTYPTLLELMLEAEQMLQRIHATKNLRHLLSEVDLEKFYSALHHRAHYLLNGRFWPEIAMFFKNSARIVDSFFIRHHAFRVRIDDVGHYLSSFLAYYRYLEAGKPEVALTRSEIAPGMPEGPWIAFGGDVNLGRRQHLRSRQMGDANALANVLPLRQADLSIVNLECVVATFGEQGVRKGEQGPYYFRARPEMLALLEAAGVRLVSTANNHSGDYGPDALLEQAAYLDAIKIAHAGTGANLSLASAPAYARAGEFSVAVFSIDATQPHFAAEADRPGSWYLPLDNPRQWHEELAPRIADARRRAHIVLVAVHWGDNLERAPSQNEVLAGHAIIEAGADAVLGSSAHILQGVEVYQGRPIIHDAGDLLFDSIRMDYAPSGVFSLAVCADGVTAVRFSPVNVGYGFSESATGEDARRITLKFLETCKGFKTRFSLTESAEAVLSLGPLSPRSAKPEGVAASSRVAVAPAQFRTPQPTWIVDKVPPEAQIAPLKLGPLILLGYRVPAGARAMKRRQMLWVESYWMIEESTDNDYLLDIQGKPIAEGSMPNFGLGMAHDPCDWMWPTSRWKPGTIYRDYYGLRPPLLEKMISMDFRLHFAVVDAQERSWIHVMPDIFRLRLSGSFFYCHEFPGLEGLSQPGNCWNQQELEVVTGGKWLTPPPAGWFVNSVVRGKAHIGLLPAPTLYVASDHLTLASHEGTSSKKSANWDTHRRLDQLAPQLAGVIVQREVKTLPADFPQLQVQDPIRALVELGLAARQRFQGKVIAVTGTAGKSSVVTMLAHVLSRNKRVVASIDNYNSRVGVPAMLANLPYDADFCVLEAAQSALWMKRGPITISAKPHLSIITEIGISQTDNRRVKTVEDTAKWKSRIFQGLTGESVALFGTHLPCLEYVLKAARKHAREVMMFGDGADSQARIIAVDAHAEGNHVSAIIRGESIDFYVPVPGEAAVRNAMAVMCAVAVLGENLADAARQLASYTPIEGRLNHLTISLPAGAVRILDDSWNATVLSMENALRTFAPLAATGAGRKIGILGRIVHLGESAKYLHEGLREAVLGSGCDLVLTHGDEMIFLREVLPAALLGPHFSDAPGLVRHVVAHARAGDLLLIKGSRRDSDFGSIADLLRKAAIASDRDLAAHV